MFQIGDKVRVKAEEKPNIPWNKDVLVIREIEFKFGGEILHFEERHGGWFARRFELVEQEAVMPRAIVVGDFVRWNGGDMGNKILEGKCEIGDQFEVVGLGAADDGRILQIKNDVRNLGNLHVWSKAFDLVEEEAPVPALPHGFNVGDRVYYIPMGHVDGKKYGIVINDPRQNEDAVYCRFEGRNHIGRMPKDRMFLDKAAPVVEQKKGGPLTRFVFCSRGGKYYEKRDFNSLEDATRWAKQARKNYGTNDIFPFVIVED